MTAAWTALRCFDEGSAPLILCAILWAMALVSAGVIVVIFQMVTADMVPFIYFQF